MNVKWLLEPEVFQYESTSLLEALDSKGIEYKVCKFGTTYEDLVLKAFPGDDCVVVHGSLQLGREARKRTHWVPGVYCNLPKFECLYYYPRFGTHLLNSDYVMLPFGDVKRRRNWLFENFGVDECIFIRPSSGFKTFTGQIVEFSDWERELRGLSFKIDPEALLLICKPVEVIREWRLVVSDRVIAHSQYKEGQGLIRITGSDAKRVRETPEAVLKYGEQLLAEVKFKPDPIWTLDICETAAGEIKVLEVGSFSCAGLYACDPHPIIDEVNRLALQEWENTR